MFNDLDQLMLNEDLEVIADEISNIIDQIKALNVQVNSIQESKLSEAVNLLLDAEDKVRFLL